MTLPVIAHLVDDTSAGGVTRFLAALSDSEVLGRQAEHRVVAIRRGRMPRRLQADMIVSHLSVSWRTLPSLIAMRAQFATRPFLHMEHSYSAAFEADRVARKARFRSLLSTAYALFDGVIAVSRAQAAWLTENRLADAGTLHVMPPTVALEEFLAVPSLAGPVRKFGAIGRFDAQKGFDVVIEAFRKCRAPGLSLQIVGDGPERARLVALAGDDDRIAFLPFAADPAEAMARMDAVVMPSRWEPYGLVALEARAAGRPLLVSTADGLQDHAAAGAVAVDTLTVDAWSAAIDVLARDGAARRAEMARADAALAVSRMEVAWETLISKSLRCDNLVSFPVE